METSQSHR